MYSLRFHRQVRTIDDQCRQSPPEWKRRAQASRRVHSFPEGRGHPHAIVLAHDSPTNGPASLVEPEAQVPLARSFIINSPEPTSGPVSSGMSNVRALGRNRTLAQSTSTMRATWPAAGTALPLAKALATPADSPLSSLSLFRRADPADPFVAGQRGDVSPRRQGAGVVLQCGSKVPGKFMDGATGNALVIYHSALNRFSANVCNGSKADTGGNEELKLRRVWRSLRKLLRQLHHVERISLLKRLFAQLVLLDVMLAAQADGPTVGWLEAEPAVGVPTNVGTLDRSIQASRHAAVVAPDPGAVSRTFTAIRSALRSPEAVR